MPIYHISVNSPRPFSLGETHTPYMVLPVENGFSCAHCKALVDDGDGTFSCASPHYREFMGHAKLTDGAGGFLRDPSKACSDWFTPREGGG